MQDFVHQPYPHFSVKPSTSSALQGPETQTVRFLVGNGGNGLWGLIIGDSLGTTKGGYYYWGLYRDCYRGMDYGTIVGDYIGTTIGIHPQFPY